MPCASGPGLFNSVSHAEAGANANWEAAHTTEVSASLLQSFINHSYD